MGFDFVMFATTAEYGSFVPLKLAIILFDVRHQRLYPIDSTNWLARVEFFVEGGGAGQWTKEAKSSKNILPHTPRAISTACVFLYLQRSCYPVNQ